MERGAMIIAGFGFNGKASAASLADALDATGYATSAMLLATAWDKADHPTIVEFATSRDLTIIAIPPDKLEAIQTQTQSVISRLTRRTGSVAEAAAIACATAHAGANVALLTTRKISNDRTATCAIAEGIKP
jgi:cobalt-precorrin 5A hydrolase